MSLESLESERYNACSQMEKLLSSAELSADKRGGESEFLKYYFCTIYCNMSKTS